MNRFIKRKLLDFVVWYLARIYMYDRDLFREYMGTDNDYIG